MECPSCGHLNREGARFCAQCATPLTDAVTCPSCGTENVPAAKHCDSCGQALTSTAAPIATPDPRSYTPEHLAEKIRAARAALEGERKQVTVLFADMMGSMELAEQSDPEELRAIMDRFFSILCAGVHRFEGTVDKFTGDGAMALFGAPIAHEDHARRACYAALQLQRDLVTYAAELRREQGLGFSVRMGLNSGEVVVGAIGEDLGMEYTALGHTVGLAQRMEQLAEPGKTYVTQHTASLVEGYLALADLGEFPVKGVSRPLRVHELTGVGVARASLDVARARGFSQFVGREEEMRLLESTLEQAFSGQGQVIGIVGETGVGKSRLCHEFAERRRAKGIPVYHLAGQAHAKSVPLLPVLQLLRSYFEITERDSDRTARERIAGKLLLLDESFGDDLPLLFDFLAVPDPERPPTRMDPEARQRQILGLMKRLSHAESAREPGLTVFEDLHWLDPASETFLANQVEAVQGTRSLTVLNFRPEYRAAWMSRSYYRQLALAPLGAEAIEEMLADLLGSDPSLDGLSELVRERTQGNPFFIEELVQSLVEAGSLEGERGAYRLVRPVAEAAVPASVQAVLSARIDRLPRREKAVLQAAAVIGKEFSEPVLAHVFGLAQPELEDALRNLVAAEFVYEQELYPEALYAFKHPLTQEVAYGSQLGERRTTVHAAVARAIAEHYPEQLDERAALLAQHWEAAGETLEATRWHARAAAWSGYNDPTQALRHWSSVRELTDALPKSAESVAQGLNARISLLDYGWRLGISREQEEALFREAERMAAEAGDIRSQARLLLAYGLVRGLSGGDVQEWIKLARQAFALAEQSGDPALYPMAVGRSAYGFFSTGQYREGVALCDRAIELADGNPNVRASASGGRRYAFCYGFKGFLFSFMGELEQARQLIEPGRKLARDQEDMETVGLTHMYSAWLAHFVGEPGGGLGHAQQTLEIAERIGGPFSRVAAWFSLGSAEQRRCEWQRSIEAFERSFAIARESRVGAELDAWCLGLLAESYLGLGDTERARELVEEGLEIARVRGQPGYEIPASLALARILLGSGDAASRTEIEAALARTLELARDVGAKSYEPLVHVELAELARQSSDEEEHERELREAHRLFAETGATGHAERLAAELAMPAS
jgi:class 3 adenylate cyclase/tetratricopeptide (TPR) repeat protein